MNIFGYQCKLSEYRSHWSTVISSSIKWCRECTTVASVISHLATCPCYKAIFWKILQAEVKFSKYGEKWRTDHVTDGSGTIQFGLVETHYCCQAQGLYYLWAPTAGTHLNPSWSPMLTVGISSQARLGQFYVSCWEQFKLGITFPQL